METLKLLANAFYVLALLGSLGLLAYFTAVGLNLMAMPNGFWGG